MASLIATFRDVFTSTIVARGQSYYNGGCVRRVSDTPEEFAATVRGSSNYTVRLERDGAELVVECSCPYFESNLDFCKHIVATILCAEADSAAVLEGAIRSLEIADIDDDWEDEEDWDEPDEDELDYVPVSRYRGRPSRDREPAYRPAPPKRPPWQQQLAPIVQATPQMARVAQQWEDRRELYYIVDASASQGDRLVVELNIRERRMNGEWGAIKTYRPHGAELPHLPDATDRRIVASLLGARPETSYGYGYYGYASETATRYQVTAPLAAAIVRDMCATGRCLVRTAAPPAIPQPVAWDPAPPWEPWLEVRPTPGKDGYRATLSLRRGDERMDLGGTVATAADLVVDATRVARLDSGGASSWIDLLRRNGELQIPRAEIDEFLALAYAAHATPRLDLPDELETPEVAPPPRPCLTLHAPKRYGSERLRAELAFDYDGTLVAEGQPSRATFDRERRRIVVRDSTAEQAAADRLATLGFVRASGYNPAHSRELAPKRLPVVARDLLAEGWHVEAEGKLYRTPGQFRVEVSSGVDWFDLSATVDYGGTTVALPELLAALRRGDGMVTLDDGSFGMLPEAWLRQYGHLAGLGNAEGDKLRFRRSQVGLLDALLAGQPEVRVDRVFARARAELERFSGIEAVAPPATFQGELRPYQTEGLGWLLFLQRFGFGGCLADDMGLGKTVTVLALLEAMRASRSKKRRRTSLAVVPKSLVFNWKLEAARFTPKLRVLDHTGTGRPKSAEGFEPYDLVLTTYGTLRRDAALFKDARFHYVILDEAQAIKNASTDSAKAARLLDAEHRLAMSGTPVENHLGELWSLFEFLNPGLLGTAPAFRLFGAGGRTVEPETRDMLAKALRPFILRRTKDQVAKDLPAKSEQTIYCDLEPAQRKLYDQLLRHYRESLLGRVERDGINRAKIQVLEALLRLRQAACHPGLIDKKRTVEPSAKLDALLEHVRQVVAEGHKALVFSQFTSLLAIVRDRLDSEGAVYEYLDGKTRDRASRVERYQTDEACKLFLISLRAGGLGLNLTAAEYVFLLDPWWNPAVEAQAIDRAHRIGQTRRVFAYRLIARNTVEEKVLELQRSKRDLADAIIRADAGLIRELSADDLRLLLS